MFLIWKLGFFYFLIFCESIQSASQGFYAYISGICKFIGSDDVQFIVWIIINWSTFCVKNDRLWILKILFGICCSLYHCLQIFSGAAQLILEQTDYGFFVSYMQDLIQMMMLKYISGTTSLRFYWVFTLHIFQILSQKNWFFRWLKALLLIFSDMNFDLCKTLTTLAWFIRITLAWLQLD